MIKILGVFFVLLPFIIVMLTMFDDWRQATKMIGFTILMAGSLVLGSYLLKGGF